MSETEPQFKGPAIAVVVPVHNGGCVFAAVSGMPWLRRPLATFACFVVDDGSTDESAELCRRVGKPGRRGLL